MPNILYISYDGMTDPLGQSQVIPYLAGLSKKGYSITLLSCEKLHNFDKYNQKIAHLLKENNIEWVPLKYRKNPPILSTVLDVRSITKKAIELHKVKNFQIVHCRSYISALVGLKLKQQLGIKFIFDMRGFWADERVDGKLWNLKNPLYNTVYRFFKRKEKDYLTHANYTISLTNNAKNEIHSWKGFEKTKIQVIPCCVDLNHFVPKAKHEAKAHLGFTENSFILSYIGSLGTWYMLDQMLDFFVELLKTKPEALFFFITKDDKELIFTKALGKGIPKEKIVVKPAERNEVPLFISVSDLSVFFIKPAYSKKASSPTKQGEIMAMNVPIVCNAFVGDTDFVVNTYHSGILVEEFTSGAYQKALKTYFDSTFLNLRQGAEDFYSLEKGVDLYESVYKSVMSIK